MITRSKKQVRRDMNRLAFYKRAPECLKANLHLLNEIAAQHFFRDLRKEIVIARFSADVRRASDLSTLLRNPLCLAATVSDNLYVAKRSQLDIHLLPHSMDFLSYHKEEYKMYVNLRCFREARAVRKPIPMIAAEGRIFPLKGIEYRQFCCSVMERQMSSSSGFLPSLAEMNNQFGIERMTSRITSPGMGETRILYKDTNTVDRVLTWLYPMSQRILRFIVAVPSLLEGKAPLGLNYPARAVAYRTNEHTSK